MGTWGLLRNSVNLLMDAVPEHIPHNEVLKYLQALPGVTEVHDLHIWGLSTKETALTAHLIIPEGGLSDSLHNKINADLAHEFQIHHITLQIESGSGDFVCEQMDSC